MIIRFDTPELAEKRFDELKEKYNPGSPEGIAFTVRIGEEDETVEMRYILEDDAESKRIRMFATPIWCVKNLVIAMKIVDLMQEVQNAR